MYKRPSPEGDAQPPDVEIVNQVPSVIARVYPATLALLVPEHMDGPGCLPPCFRPTSATDAIHREGCIDAFYAATGL